MEQPNRMSVHLMRMFDQLPAEIRALANEQGDAVVWAWWNQRKDEKAVLRKVLREIEM